MMMFTNCLQKPVSVFFSRKTDTGKQNFINKLMKNLGVVFTLLLFLPVALIAAPTTVDSCSVYKNDTEVGVFGGLLTGLNTTETYYIRSYAINPDGTAYGNEVTTSTDLGAFTVTPIENTNQEATVDNMINALSDFDPGIKLISNKIYTGVDRATSYYVAGDANVIFERLNLFYGQRNCESCSFA